MILPANGVVTGLLSYFVCSIAFAQTVEVDSRFEEHKIVEYNNTLQMPDETVFGVTLQFFDDLPDEMAEGILARDSGLGETASRDLLSRLRATKAAIDSDQMSARTEIGCTSQGTQRVYGNNVPQVLQAMEDSDTAILAEHLAQLKDDIGDDESAKLQKFLDRRKLQSSSARHDIVKGMAAMGETGDSLLAALCAKWTDK